MPTSCCAYNCYERSKPGGSISFHRFPTKNEMLFRAWCVALRRKNFHPTWGSRVCSKHFTKDSYQKNCTTRTLKIDAVPTIFDFSKNGDKRPRGKKSHKTRESNKRNQRRYKAVDLQSDEGTDTGSEMYSFEEKPNVVEIVKLKRENADEESERECDEEQFETSEFTQVYETAEDGVTVGKLVTIDSLPSDQSCNMENENEILRHTIHHLSKKIERFKCLTNVLRSNELISEEAAEVLRCTIDMKD